MAKYKIYWREYHNPLNWDDTFEEGVKAIKESLPKDSVVHLDLNENDGWIECECFDYFEAEDIFSAKKIIENSYSGTEQDIFTVSELKGDLWARVFTEEDMD